jgi:hypothetical protein
MDERRKLLEQVHEAGVDGVADRWDDERLASMAVDAALGGPGKHTLTALARAAGVSTATARAVMLALGRPQPARGERLFTDDDVELVKAHKQLLATASARPS